MDLFIAELILCFICISFLSGYALLNLLGYLKNFTAIESIILSIVTSYLYSGFLTLTTLFIDQQDRGYYISLAMLAVGLLFLVKTFLRREKNELSISLASKKDLYAIVISMVFYVFVFALMYPGAALLKDVDVTRHFNNTLILSNSPDLYTGFNYLLFHAFGAALHSLTGLDQSVAAFQSIQVIINLALPLAIYALSKRYLYSIDHRIPPLSVLLYTFFSNLSFIYFSLLRNEGYPTNLAIFQDVGEKSLGGAIFLQPFHYFTPMSISFLILIVLFIVIKINYISKVRLVSIVTILVFSLNLVHVSEGMAFLIFIVILSFAPKISIKRFEKILLGIFIGTILTDVVIIYETFFWQGPLKYTQFTNIAWVFFSLTVVLGFVYLYRLFLMSRFIKSNDLHSTLDREWIRTNKVISYFQSNLSVVVVWVLLFVYILSLLVWLTDETIHVQQISTTGYIPWFIYPVAYGIVGLLSIISLVYYSRLPFDKRDGFNLIMQAVLIMFLIGKIISIINSNFFNIGYTEQRLIMISFLFATFLAPISLIRLFDTVRLRVNGYRFTVIIACTLSFVVLIGFSSLMLQVEFWSLFVQQAKIGDQEWQAINYLRDILYNDKYAFTIAPSFQSKESVVFSSPPYNFPIPQIITSSVYPHIPLLAFSIYNLDHPYLYIHNRDRLLLNMTSTNWFTNQYFPTLPVVYSNDEISILNISDTSPPQIKSNLTLVVPARYTDTSWMTAYDIFYNSKDIYYTEKLETDPRLYDGKHIFLTYDPDLSTINSKDFLGDDNNAWKSVSGNWSYFPGRLHGENIDSKMESIIIREPWIDNLSRISTTFKINNITESEPNYVSLVYSFVDPNNYRFAGLNIYNDNIYVNSYRVNNGSLASEFVWPGAMTGLKWNSGSIFNMDLYSNNGSYNLALNGSNYKLYEHGVNETQGFVGLGYNGVKSVDFKRFDRWEDEMMKQMILNSYFQFIKDGGNLYVLNTNGYGTFSQLISNISMGYSIANSLKNDLVKTFSGNGIPLNFGDNYTIANSLKNDLVKTFSGNGIPLNFGDNYTIANSLKNDLVKTFSEDVIFTYHNTINNTVPIITKHIGEGKITYIDIHPIMNKLFENKLSRENVSKIMNSLGTFLPHSKIQHKGLELNGMSIFKEMRGDGAISLNTSSLILGNNYFTEIVASKEPASISIPNVTNLAIKADSIIVSSDANFSLANGRGFYGMLKLEGGSNHITELKFNNGKIEGLSNGHYFQLRDVPNLTLYGQPITLYLDKPFVEVNGNATLKEYYYGKFINPKQDRSINGTISFNLRVSDYYTVVNNLTVSDSHKRAFSSVNSYDDSDFSFSNLTLHKIMSLPPVVWVLLTFITIIVTIFAFYIIKN
jgi:hypothetical protein